MPRRPRERVMDVNCSDNAPANNSKCERKGKAIGLRKGVAVGLYVARKKVSTITDPDELRARVRKSKPDIFKKLNITRFDFGRLDRVGFARLKTWLGENGINYV